MLPLHVLIFVTLAGLAFKGSNLLYMVEGPSVGHRTIGPKVYHLTWKSTVSEGRFVLQEQQQKVDLFGSTVTEGRFVLKRSNRRYR